MPWVLAEFLAEIDRLETLAQHEQVLGRSEGLAENLRLVHEEKARIFLAKAQQMRLRLRGEGADESFT